MTMTSPTAPPMTNIMFRDGPSMSPSAESWTRYSINMSAGRDRRLLISLPSVTETPSTAMACPNGEP